MSGSATYRARRFYTPSYTATGARKRVRRRGPRAIAIRPAQRGYVRRVGYYGRFTRGGERKFFNTVVDDAVVAATMAIVNLTIIPEGNGESERIGRKITITKISVLYSMQLPAATAQGASSDTMRCMLVQDKQTNGAQFAATDLIDLDNFNEFNNLANSKRFKILYKQEFNFNSGGAVATGAAFAFAEFRHYLRMTKKVNIPIEYDNSANDGTIGTVRSNNIYWVTQSESGLVAAVGRVRLRYTDL